MKKSTQELKDICLQLRRDIINMIYLSRSGHPGGSLSCVEIVAALYFGGILNASPERRDDPERDRFVMSKGHCCPTLYAALARRGYFDVAELSTLRRYHSILQGHPDMRKTPGVDMTSGSLGNGLSCALGMALSAKAHGRSYYVYTLLGDGELQEGSNWEAVMAAKHHGLERFIAVVDFNGLQINGKTSDIMNIEPLADKWRAFGWKVLECDGHDVEAVVSSLEEARSMIGPTVIIAHTVKGKGVPFMENNAAWHGKAPSKEEFESAMNYLKGGEC